jgi:hypothetical protein
MSDTKKVSEVKETVLVKGEFKGHATVSIYELNDKGEKSEFQLLGFGKKKAQAIVKHFEDIKQLAES